MFLRHLVSIAFTLGSLVVTTSALAADANANANAAKSDDALKGLKGFELMLRPSFGGAPADSPMKLAPNANVKVSGDPPALLKGSAPWKNGFVGDLSVGYRFLPFLSAGLAGGYRMASGDELGDGSKNLSRTGWNAGFYARFYPAVFAPSVARYVDPWLSAGIAYAHDGQSFEQLVPVANGTTTQGQISIEHHAVSVPLAIGVDFRATKFLSIGPSFALAINDPIAAAITTSAPGFAGSTYWTNTEPGKSVFKAETYAVWSAGLDAKVTF